jgi:hypothetical protein
MVMFPAGTQKDGWKGFGEEDAVVKRDVQAMEFFEERD